MHGLAAGGEPGTEALADMSKIVFSSSLNEPLEWPNSRLVSGDAVAAVRELKDDGGESRRTLGSLTLGSRTFDGQLQLVEYVPTVLAGPPGTETDDA